MIVGMRRINNHHYEYKGRSIQRVPSPKPYNPWLVRPYTSQTFPSLKAAAAYIESMEKK